MRGGESACRWLLAHPNVLGWVGGHRHAPAALQHGVRDSRLWEVTPSMLGFGCHSWLAYQRRHADEWIRRHSIGRVALAV